MTVFVIKTNTNNLVFKHWNCTVSMNLVAVSVVVEWARRSEYFIR